METRFLEKNFSFESFPTRDQIIDDCFERPLGDELKILPHPLVLSSSEYETLRKNAYQRHLTLQMFFADLVFDGGKIFEKKFESGLSRELIEKIFNGQGKSIKQVQGFWSQRNKEDISGWSGGDLVRRPDGKWTVIEDNLGNIEGRVSTPFVHDFFFHLLSKKNPYQVNDLQAAIECFLREKNLEPDSEECIAVTCTDGKRFLGNARTQKVLDAVGLRGILWNEIDEDFESNIREGQISALVNFNTGNWPGGKKKLSQVFQNSKAHFFEAPFFKIVCDKALLPFMPDLIEHYLGEEPICSSPETYLLQEFLIPEKKEDWVLKVTNSHSGEGVFILDEMSDEEIEKLENDFEHWSQMNDSDKPLVLAQKRIQPSIIPLERDGLVENYQIEIRVPAYSFGWKKIRVSEQITARAIPLSTGDSRCHVLRGACSVPVTIVD